MKILMAVLTNALAALQTNSLSMAIYPDGYATSLREGACIILWSGA